MRGLKFTNPQLGVKFERDILWHYLSVRERLGAAACLSALPEAILCLRENAARCLGVAKLSSCRPRRLCAAPGEALAEGRRCR